VKAFDPAPGILWTLTKEGREASCDIRFVPIGVEARIKRNGKLLYARTFPLAVETLEWAEEERQEHVASGWHRIE
jgi:hypothetical protein